MPFIIYWFYWTKFITIIGFFIVHQITFNKTYTIWICISNNCELMRTLPLLTTTRTCSVGLIIFLSNKKKIIFSKKLMSSIRLWVKNGLCHRLRRRNNESEQTRNHRPIGTLLTVQIVWFKPNFALVTQKYTTDLFLVKFTAVKRTRWLNILNRKESLLIPLNKQSNILSNIIQINSGAENI